MGDLKMNLKERANKLRDKIQSDRRKAIKKYYATRSYKDIDVLEGD